MNALSNLSLEQLKRAVDVKQRIEALEQELNALLLPSPAAKIARTSTAPAVRRSDGAGRGKVPWGAAKRAKMAAIKRAWWARRRRAAGNKPIKLNRKLTPAAHANLSRAARERWARAKAAGRNRL